MTYYRKIDDLDESLLNRQINMFNKTIKNIMSNYIPHETFICDDRDPPWMIKISNN